MLLLGAVSVGLLFWTSRISDRQRMLSSRVDAVREIRILATTFHLWFEESLTAGTRDEMRQTLTDLDAAMTLSRSIVDGGKLQSGMALPPLDDPASRSKAETIQAILADLRALAFRRMENPEVSGIGSPSDKRFNLLYRDAESTARALESTVADAVATDHTRTKRLQFLILLTWGAVVASSAIGLYDRERRRRRAEIALAQAYGEMEQRVLDRTAELAGTNRQLEEEIAERRRAEESLRKSEQEFKALSVQFETLLDNIPDRITLVSRDLKVLWANRGGAGDPGGKTGDHRGKPCYALRHNRATECTGCPAAATFADGRLGTARITTSEGRHWDLRTVPLAGADGQVENVLELATEVTEKVFLQAETERAARLASIGELAAGVAHEINNPINGIINYAQIICNKSPDNGREHDLASRIMREGDRISAVVRGLLSFARETKSERRPVRMEEILAETFTLTQSQLAREGIRLAVAIPPDLPRVVASPRQIQQVFLNLVSNARYALNQKYPEHHEDKILEISGERIVDGGEVFVRTVFRDNGTGIAAGHLDRVMKPFFSTKPSGKGTGLGLSISHAIVSEHGGRMRIESLEGAYTRVVVELPAREGTDG
jgi:C4-dicarboxylate-specific signal transduction histidine kinase